tara:strand:- start:238 stop:369 length:132 start_codon:yes stop_codon:yes gene_type:complete
MHNILWEILSVNLKKEVISKKSFCNADEASPFFRIYILRVFQI